MDWVIAHRNDIALALSAFSVLVTVVGFFIQVDPKHTVTKRAALLILTAIALGSGYVFLLPVTPPAAPTPVALTIAGSASNGVRYSIPSDGVYRITVTGGAYSPWTDDGTRQGQWRTLLDVYLDNASWAVTSYSQGPNDYTPSVAARIGFVGCDFDWNDKATATACGQRSTPFERRLDAGHGLVLVPIDSEGEYVGNREQVFVLITYVGP